MSRLLALLLLIPCIAYGQGMQPVGYTPTAASPPAGITYKAVTENQASGSASSISGTTTLNVAAGDTIIIGVAYENTCFVEVTVGTDVATKVKSGVVGTYYYEAHIVSNASANATATVTASFYTDDGKGTPSAAIYRTIAATSYSGCATSSAVDQSSCNNASCDATTATSTDRTAVDVSTANANDLLWAFVIDWDNVTSHAGANSYTKRTTAGDALNWAIADKIVSSTGTYPNGAFMTTGTTQPYVSLFVAVKAAT